MRRRPLLLVLALTSCVSMTSTFTTGRGACATRPELLGEWRSTRASSLGPATMTITLDCDCRYSTRVGMLIGRIKEQGEYRIENDRIVFSRESGETSWPFVLDGARLRLTESADETHEYAKSRAVTCPL